MSEDTATSTSTTTSTTTTVSPVAAPVQVVGVLLPLTAEQWESRVSQIETHQAQTVEQVNQIGRDVKDIKETLNLNGSGLAFKAFAQMITKYPDFVPKLTEKMVNEDDDQAMKRAIARRMKWFKTPRGLVASLGTLLGGGLVTVYLPPVLKSLHLFVR